MARLFTCRELALEHGCSSADRVCLTSARFRSRALPAACRDRRSGAHVAGGMSSALLGRGGWLAPGHEEGDVTAALVRVPIVRALRWNSIHLQPATSIDGDLLVGTSPLRVCPPLSR